MGLGLLWCELLHCDAEHVCVNLSFAFSREKGLKIHFTFLSDIIAS